MLHLVIGPCCAGKSTYIHSRLAAQGLTLSNVLFAGAALRGGAGLVRELLEASGTLYLHWPSPGSPELQPKRRRLLTALSTLPFAKDALLLVADAAELVQRAHYRTCAEPLLCAFEPGPFQAAESARRLRNFDPADFVAAWSAELGRLRVPCSVFDTGAQSGDAAISAA